MATYTVTENATEATIGSIIYTGWGTVDGGILPDEQLGAELPVTVGAYTIQLVYTYKDATSPPEPGNEFGWRYGIVLTGDHTGGSDFFPTDLRWTDTQRVYGKNTIKEAFGWSRSYDASNDLTGWLGPITLDYPTTYTGYEDATGYSPVITQGDDVTHYLNGLLRNANGYLVVTTTGAVDHHLHGLPFSAAHSLCVELAAVASWSNGWPITSNGKVAIA